MRSPAAQPIRIEEIYPLGSVTLAPEAMTGCSELELARSMAEAVSEAGQHSTAAALKELRQTFPDMPLSLRLTALHLLLRRKG